MKITMKEQHDQPIYFEIKIPTLKLDYKTNNRMFFLSLHIHLLHF